MVKKSINLKKSLEPHVGLLPCSAVLYGDVYMCCVANTPRPEDCVLILFLVAVVLFLSVFRPCGSFLPLFSHDTVKRRVRRDREEGEGYSSGEWRLRGTEGEQKEEEEDVRTCTCDAL